MSEDEIFVELETINEDSTSEQIEAVYNQIFSEIAHDHSGVYYAEKIDWIEKLVNIYHHTANNRKKSILISAMLNNLYYFEIDNQNPQTAQQVKDLLDKFNDENWQKLEINMKSMINVAVAIIHYGEKYLLGYRNASQHQGKKYEFIGGKIEQDELPKQALIREVSEEIGCDISANTTIKMGIIRHNYSDKSVALHCFKIELTQSQFEQLQGGTGTEGQAITWAEKSDLLAKKYPLPEANARILDWLQLPNIIFISQALDNFTNEKDWIDFYAKKLPQNSVLYCRLQADLEKSFSTISSFLTRRKDILPLIPFKLWQQFSQDFENINCIIHLNHAELMTLDFADLPKNQRYFASCHDKNSLSKVNQLAQSHIVMGRFLSPVLATPTHPETIANGGMGWEKFAELAEMCDVPVFGLGGLGRDDLEKVWENNGFGVAGIRLIQDFPSR